VGIDSDGDFVAELEPKLGGGNHEFEEYFDAPANGSHFSSV
jgi:hypothetical protein